MDLEGKLASANDWVREEFTRLSDVAFGLGCDARPDGGPGVVFRLGERVIVRLHPKRRHIAVGFPNWMRDEVDALTGALRAQLGMAWLNCARDVCDHDTVELLITKSLQSSGVSGASMTEPEDRNDQADLGLILAVLRAFVRHERQTGRPSAVKAIRETIFLEWEGPHLPPGGRYSREIAHSPTARKQRANGNNRALVYDHVIPVAIVIRRLLTNLPADEQGLLAILDATSDRVIITKDEDAALTAAGVGSNMPPGESAWSRYRAIGLTRSDFAPLVSEPRHLAARKVRG